MELQELHRGRLLDHIQLVMRNLAATQRFCDAVFNVLDIAMGALAMVFSGPMSCSFQRPTATPPHKTRYWTALPGVPGTRSCEYGICARPRR
jgi:hypothetical protein